MFLHGMMRHLKYACSAHLPLKVCRAHRLKVGEKKKIKLTHSQVFCYRSRGLSHRPSIWHYLGFVRLQSQLSPALSSLHQWAADSFLLCDPGSQRLRRGRVMTRNWKEIQGDGCDGGRLRTKCKGVKKQMALFIWKCSVLHPLRRLVTHRLTTSCILWVFLTLGHCLTLKWYMALQWQKLKWGFLKSFMQNASSYYDNTPPSPMHTQYTVYALPWDETRIFSKGYKATCTMKRKAVLSVT